MTKKIDKILKKTTENIEKASSQTSSKAKQATDQATSADHYVDYVGDPNCPHCEGVGYLRQDVPVGHPDFGKLSICVCREADVQAQMRERLYAISNLDRLEDKTFETFDERGRIGLGAFQADSIEWAFNQAYQFSHKLEGWLLFQGKYGCGKTHLAAAIANEATSFGIASLFITVPDLLDSLRYAYSNQSITFEERFEQIRRTPLLILDDFGTQNATDWAEEKLFQILNYRYINKLPLVVTTNLQLDDLDPRLRSRLQDPELVTLVKMMAPDYRRPMDDTGHHELSSLGLLASRTFGNFDLRKKEGLPKDDVKALTKAFQAAQKYAEKPTGWLILLGVSGTGKTHLAAAIANYRAGLGFPPLFIMAPDLLDHLRATFAPESRVRLDRLFEEIRTTPFLILDDLGTQSMTPWAREKLNQLFNHRYIAELPTVITMADSIDELNRREPRIVSRMVDERVSSIYALGIPPYYKRNR